jgi:hypothetical protein
MQKDAPSVPGAVAQLGERVNGIHEVRGSIPLGSTNALNKRPQPTFDRLTEPVLAKCRPFEGRGTTQALVPM